MANKNIIMIVTDQHRVDTLKFYNDNTLVNTPNLNKLAEESAVFENCYCSNPVCTPARSSIQLGLYPSKTGFETNSFEIGSRTHVLPDVEYTLPRRLQAAGYTTAYTGKWHLGLPKDKTKTREGSWFLNDLENKNLSTFFYKDVGSLPSDHGYIGDDFEGHGVGGWYYPQYLEYVKSLGKELKIENVCEGNRQGDHTTWGEVTSGIETTVEHFVVERSKKIIEYLKDNPFYFQINFWGPHEPFFPPVEYYEKYKNIDIPVWENFESRNTKINDILRREEKDFEFFKEALKHYYAYIEYIDYEIGRLIDYLKAQDLYDDTVIIFTADHGDYQGTHGHMENKSYGMYDDITKIPLLIKDGVNKGTFSELVGTCDIHETILDYAKVDLKQFETDGNSIRNIFENKNWDNSILSESMGAFPLVVTQRMYRNERYKYIFVFGADEEIYDMLEDPNEMNNLVNDENLLEKLRLECLEKMEKNNDPVRHMFAKINRIGDFKIN